MSTIPIKPRTDKTSSWENIKNTGRGVKLLLRNLVAGAEALAWVIALGTCVAVIYSDMKGSLALNNFALGAVAFAAAIVSIRMGWEFVVYLNKQGQKYEN